MSRPRVLLRAAVAALAVIGLAGCASTGAMPDPVGTTATAVNRPEITVKLGTLLPPNAEGDSTRAAVQLAAQTVNDADLGVRFDVVNADSSVADPAQAAAGAQELIDAGVDAVIGPRSSVLSLAVYRMFADAGVVELSPASTLEALGAIDDGGYYFRTVPSDALQSRILGNRILFDGATTVGIVRIDDEYGAGLAAGLTETLDAAGADVVADVIVVPGSEVEAASAVLAQDPEAVIVIVRSDGFGPLAQALDAQGVDWSSVYGTDASREVFKDRTDVPEIGGAVFSAPGVLADLDFVTALHRVDPGVTLYGFAPEAYDAVVLVALAALRAASSDGSVIRDELIPVSRGPGVLVEDFADGARHILAGDDIDYDGLSGPLDFLPNGDVGSGFVSFYRYGAGNELRWIDQSWGSTDAR